MIPYFALSIPSCLANFGNTIAHENLMFDKAARPRFIHGQSYRPAPAVCPHCGGVAEVEQVQVSRAGGPVQTLLVTRCASNKVRAGMIVPSGCPPVETVVPCG